MRLLDAAVVLDENRGFIYLPKPSVRIQRAFARLLAQVARALGRESPGTREERGREAPAPRTRDLSARG
jgi:hypothetical protein